MRVLLTGEQQSAQNNTRMLYNLTECFKTRVCVRAWYFRWLFMFCLPLSFDLRCVCVCVCVCVC